MASDLQKAIDDIRSEITVDEKGRGFASIRATARLCGVDDKGLGKNLGSAEEKPTQMARFLMSRGFDGADLIGFVDTGVSDRAVGKIITYYALHAGRHCKPQAKICLEAFNEVGIRAWMQSLVGYKPSEEIPLDLQLAQYSQRVERRLTLKDQARVDLVNACTQWAQANGQSGHTVASAVHDAINLKVFGQRSKSIKTQYGIREDELIRDFMVADVLSTYIQLCDFIAHAIMNGMNPMEAVNQICAIYLSAEYPITFQRKENIRVAGLRLKTLKIEQVGAQLCIQWGLAS